LYGAHALLNQKYGLASPRSLLDVVQREVQSVIWGDEVRIDSGIDVEEDDEDRIEALGLSDIVRALSCAVAYHQEQHHPIFSLKPQD
jgi:hypothetical protein